MFANYENGTVTINTYRFCDALSTNVDDLIVAYDNNKQTTLTANIENDEDMAAIEEISEN